VTGDLITVGAVAAAVASALVAGIMFAFSTSVMPALGRRPAPEGIAAMQAMNSAILNPAFGLAFSGAALLCAALAVTAPFTVDESHALLRGLGAALYLVGTFGVEHSSHDPRGRRLGAAGDLAGVNLVSPHARVSAGWEPHQACKISRLGGAAVSLGRKQIRTFRRLVLLGRTGFSMCRSGAPPVPPGGPVQRQR